MDNSAPAHPPSLFTRVLTLLRLPWRILTWLWQRRWGKCLVVVGGIVCLLLVSAATLAIVWFAYGTRISPEQTFHTHFEGELGRDSDLVGEGQRWIDHYEWMGLVTHKAIYPREMKSLKPCSDPHAVRDAFVRRLETAERKRYSRHNPAVLASTTRMECLENDGPYTGWGSHWLWLPDLGVMYFADWSS